MASSLPPSVLSAWCADTCDSTHCRGNYCKLFFFLFYIVFYSVVLFQQNMRRDFELVDFHRQYFFPDGYEAGEDNFYSTEDVYEWLTDRVTTIWTDPICGNGKCEMPYEFPSYHRCASLLHLLPPMLPPTPPSALPLMEATCRRCSM